MDTFASKSTQRNWLLCLLAPIALLLSGCNISVTDLTPSSMRANPSSVYTIASQIAVKNTAVVKESLRPQVVIDGKIHPMSLAPGSSSLYEYDFRMPPGRNEAAYYVLVHYQRKTENGTVNMEFVSELNRFTLENRYSVELEVNRAPVGARVAVLGRGFTGDDKIMVGDTPAATRYDSSTSLSFYVPTLPEGRGYEVKVIGLEGEIYAGSLRIDTSTVSARLNPSIISQGQTSTLVVTIPEEAPPGGLEVRVTTDIPQSVVMDYVSIQAGQRSTSVSVQGGAPGRGNLFIEIPGFSEVVVPITVN